MCIITSMLLKIAILSRGGATVGFRFKRKPQVEMEIEHADSVAEKSPRTLSA
jgi:hypothetical protein